MERVKSGETIIHPPPHHHQGQGLDADEGEIAAAAAAAYQVWAWRANISDHVAQTHALYKLMLMMPLLALKKTHLESSAKEPSSVTLVLPPSQIPISQGIEAKFRAPDISCNASIPSLSSHSSPTQSQSKPRWLGGMPISKLPPPPTPPLRPT